jgi:hypothetical protein
LVREEKKMSIQKRISFGYTRNALNKIVIYQEQAEVVKLIFELYAMEQSLSAISKILEMYHIPSPSNKPVWGRQIISNVLSNENYLGNDDYTQIIEQELWNSAQRIKSSNNYSRRYHHEEKSSGILQSQH